MGNPLPSSSMLTTRLSSSITRTTLNTTTRTTLIPYACQQGGNMQLFTIRSMTSMSLCSSHDRLLSKSDLQLRQYASKPNASGNAAMASVMSMQGPAPSKEGMLHWHATTGKMSNASTAASWTKGLKNPQSSQPSARLATLPHLPTTSIILPPLPYLSTR